jgi:hypothetical protein
MLPIAHFWRFRDHLLNLPLKGGTEKYGKADLICRQFLLFTEAELEVYYAPFHHLNPNARIALVGLTPGWTQMEEAFRAAREGLASGLNGKDLFEYIDRTGSFSGPMRNNLVAMLDGIGLNNQLGISSCIALFDSLHHLVHFTSVVSAPIFRAGANYGGSGPRLLQVPKLRTWVVENLAAELASMPQAIIVPLGRVADEAIQFLQGRVSNLQGRCLAGFPHPSGANGHRHEDFRRGREQWKTQVAAIARNWECGDATIGAARF